MKKEDLAILIKKDPYHKERVLPSEAEIRLFLKEVDYHCPLCKKELQSRKQKKINQKLFQIAHIYPNSPTIQQYETLAGLIRLGDNCESFENKIALCIECHQTQDYHTTAEEYIKLVEKKKHCLEKTALHDVTLKLGLEDEIADIVLKLTTITAEDLGTITYVPVPLSKKFSKNEFLLQMKVAYYVTNFYPYIMDCFKRYNGTNGFNLEVLCLQIKSCFLKMNDISTNKNYIFDEITNWIMRKTKSSSLEACEAIVSFFIQNCEVFYEITE